MGRGAAQREKRPGYYDLKPMRAKPFHRCLSPYFWVGLGDRCGTVSQSGRKALESPQRSCFISEPCESAWNKDPVFGVIGIQSGPPGQRVHSGFSGGYGGQVGMLVVETVAKIRRAYFAQNKPIKTICREFRVSRRVVRKVIRSQATEFRY